VWAGDAERGEVVVVQVAKEAFDTDTSPLAVQCCERLRGELDGSIIGA
jgi:hypothetical protein